LKYTKLLLFSLYFTVMKIVPLKGTQIENMWEQGADENVWN